MVYDSIISILHLQNTYLKQILGIILLDKTLIIIRPEYWFKPETKPSSLTIQKT